MGRNPTKISFLNMDFFFNQTHPFERLRAVRMTLCLIILILLSFGPYDSFYVDTVPFLFSAQPPFPWFPNLGIHFWTLKYAVLLGAVCVLFDLKRRWSRPFFALTYLIFSYYITCFGTTYWITNTHLVFFTCALCFEPENQTSPKQKQIASFILAFMITYIAVLYLQAGLSKVVMGGSEWFLDGKRIWTETLLLGTPFGKWLTQWPTFFIPMSLGTGLFELFVPFCFFFNRTRQFAACAAIAFHLGTFAIMGISFWFLWTLYPGLFLLYQSKSSTAPVCRL